MQASAARILHKSSIRQSVRTFRVRSHLPNAMSCAFSRLLFAFLLWVNPAFFRVFDPEMGDNLRVF